MPAAIPESIKAKVIEMWLQGLSRDANAKANYISNGAVSNIVKEFENSISMDIALGLRELYGLLSRDGLSIAQCAIGFRTMKLFSDQGVDPETAEHFISDLYKECRSRGITPSIIVTHTEDLIKVSENKRLPEINEYLNEKIAQNTELDEKREQLTQSIVSLEAKYSELKKNHALILEQNRKAEEEMKSYSSSKQVLDQYGISITEDFSKFTSTVKCIAEFGYDPKKVIEEFKETHYLQGKQRALRIAVDEEQKNLAKIGMQNTSLQQAINLHEHKLSVYNELENIGFGPRELKRLLDTIINIMNSNDISYWLAVDKFFKDVETQYDSKLGFEAEKERLITQIQILKEEREKRLEDIRVQLFVGPVIASLLRLGLTESDILKFAEVFLNILNRSYPVQDIVRGMQKTVEVITTSHTGTTIDDKSMEILGNVRKEFSKLDYS
jgi:hypothetical protein